VVPPADVTAEALAAWFAARDASREYRRSLYQSLRLFFEWAVSAGVATSNPAQSFRGLSMGPPCPRPLPDDLLLDALLAADRRCWLAVRLASDLGLRRAEVAGVRASHLVRDIDGWTLRVLGKGSKLRVLPCPDDLARAIMISAGEPAGFAFPGRTGGHISPAHLGKLVSRCLPEGWGMHTLRHRFATRAYGVSRDLISVQALLGHSSVATTQRYVRVDGDRLRRIVEAVQW